MPEHEPSHGQDPDDGFTVFRPIERSVNSRGEEGIIGEAISYGSTEEAIDEAQRSFLEETGGEIYNGPVFTEPDDEPGSRGIGFNADNWNAPWQPKGPKKNWGASIDSPENLN